MLQQGTLPNAATYKIKRVSDQEGRLFQIVTQSLNGPCPLLAIVNVLLLRGNIVVPRNAPEISEESLVSLVAGWLLDRTEASQAGQRATLTPEYTANLQQNVSDAVRRLPKLTTGIDINPRFGGCQEYEFTDEVGIFDLLDIPLLHGWLADPQDVDLVKAIGGASYNELSSRLVGSLREEGSVVQPLPSDSPHCLPETTTAAGIRNEVASAAAASSARSPSAAGSPVTAEGAKFTLDDDEDEEEAGATRDASEHGSFTQRLHNALTVSAVADPGDTAHCAAHTTNGAGSDSQPITPDSAAAKAFDSTLVTPGHSRGASMGGAHPTATDDDRQLETANDVDRCGQTRTQAEASSGPSVQPANGLSDCASCQSDGGASPPQDPEQTEARQAVQGLMQAVFGHHLRRGSETITREEVRLLQAFLSGSTQLTYHGLSELHGALTPGQLAVFFRNNHFCTLTKHSNGSLFTLVTDQGYLREPNVVWEQLATIDGDTHYVRADFSSTSTKDADAMQQTDAHQNTAFGRPPGFSDGPVSSNAQPVNSDADADLALALQMQEEEEAAEADLQLREHRQRQQRQSQQHQQQQSQSQQSQSHSGSSSNNSRQPRRNSQRSSGTQRRHTTPHNPTIRGRAPPKEKCSIM